MEETAVMEAKATLKYARISARKVKIVADLIRGKNVDEALAIEKAGAFAVVIGTSISEPAKIVKTILHDAKEG